MYQEAGKPCADRSSEINTSKRNYPLDCWWVAATAKEVGNEPVTRSMLHQCIVLFRTSDGSPCALTDRCPHRWTPLSRGKVIQDEIVCPYHGFRFSTKGECTHVPTERNPPRALSVRSYPTIDHGPFVWIWMGDPSKADPSLLPKINWPNDATYVRISNYRVINCNYAAIHENIADTEHVLYLHGETADTRQGVQFKRRSSGVMDVSSQDITFMSRSIDAPPSKLESLLLGLDKNQGIDSSTTAVFTVPSCFFSESTWKTRMSRPGMPDCVNGYYLWCATPISNSSCHFWWMLTYDHGHQARSEIENLWAKIMEEDIGVLEAIQSSMDRDKCHHDTSEIFLAADRAVIAIRRILIESVEAEDKARSTIR